MSELAPDGRLPQVSIGMPVYNGASSLPEVLELLAGQTMRGLEIILSDNASTDETAVICRRFAARDPRIRYFRQPATMPVTDNFRFVLAQARAPYFMWAAHDDLRDADYVERLAAALDRNDRAILAFGDVVEIIDGVPRPLALRFANGALSPAARLRSAALHPLHHLYGLWRREPLRRIRWRHNEWWHDTPPMMAATMLGEFVHVPGVVFRYRYNRHPFFDWPRQAAPAAGSAALPASAAGSPIWAGWSGTPRSRSARWPVSATDCSPAGSPCARCAAQICGYLSRRYFTTHEGDVAERNQPAALRPICNNINDNTRRSSDN